MIYWGGTPWNKGGVPDNDQQKMVLFGGTDGDVYFNDTWVLDFTPNSVRENIIFDTANLNTRWRLAVPNGEHGQVGPSPRAFAQMDYAHNAIRPRIGNNAAIAGAYLFGGRTGVLPTGRDTDDDKVEDGVEFALGGAAAGRDPRVNALTTTDTNVTEVIPYAYKRIGTPDFTLLTQDPAGDFRGAIASLEAVSWVDQPGAFGAVQGRPVEVFNQQPANVFSFSGVDGWQADFVDQWYHRFSLEQPNDPRDVWELGVPNNSVIGLTAGPPYAYRGRWAYGTDLNGNYPNNAVMELYSPLVDLVVPPVGSTDTNLTSSYYLSFYEWLDLADANDIVRVDLVKPVTPADTLRREHGDPNPPPIVLGNRNNAFNTPGAWRRQVIPLDILGTETNVYFRFTLSSDSSGVGGGWYIDDISLFQAAQISGVLTNDQGDVIEGLQVNLLGTNFNQTVLDTTVTDQNGRYQFGPLPFGNYQVGLGGNLIDVGLSPTNANPQASSSITVLITGTAVTLNGEITWPSIPGMNYVVEYTEDLSPSGMWMSLATVTAADVFTTYLDPTSGGAMRFYRVRLLLQ
jgi:hypothetical protein